MPVIILKDLIPQDDCLLLAISLKIIDGPIFFCTKSGILLPKWVANQIEHLCHNNADIFKEDVPFLWTTSIISRGTRCRPSSLQDKKTNYQTPKIKESKRTKNKKAIICYLTYYFFNVQMLKNGKEYCLSWKYLR